LRTNIYIDTPNARGRLGEDDWTGGTVRVGRDVVFADVEPTVWCVTSTLAQEELPRDLSVLRTIAQHHRGCLGVFCAFGRHHSRRRPGHTPPLTTVPKSDRPPLEVPSWSPTWSPTRQI
jgi:hypothetical protein